MSEAVETTAPSVLTLCRDEAEGIAVCLDRRLSCRVKARDTTAARAPGPADAGELGSMIAGALGRDGVSGSWEIAVQAREQGAPGLHRAGPLTLAALAAIRRAGGLASDLESVLALAEAMRWTHVSSWERLMGACAGRGGVVHVSGGVPAAAPVDPAWVEERISLFDLTPLNLPLAPAVRETGVGTGQSMLRALVERDHDSLGAFVNQDRGRSWPAQQGAQGVLDLAAAAEAPATLRGEAPSLLLVAWHRPGQGPQDPASRLRAGLRALGARPVAARLDLLGLEQG